MAGLAKYHWELVVWSGVLAQHLNSLHLEMRVMALAQNSLHLELNVMALAQVKLAQDVLVAGLAKYHWELVAQSGVLAQHLTQLKLAQGDSGFHLPC